MSRRPLALIAPLCLLAAGCAQENHPTSAGPGSAASASAVRAAPDAAVAAGSGRFEMTIEVRGREGDGQLAVRSTGAFDMVAQRAEIELDLGAMFQSLGVDAPEGFREPTRLVLDGERAYLRSELLEQLSGTQGWLSIDPSELGAGRASVLGAAGTDPAQMLEVLRGVPDHVETVGEEEIRGVATTRYRATIDLAEMLAEIPETERELLAAELDGLAPAMEDVPVEVWLDDDGLARRLRMDIDRAEGGAGGGGPTEGTLTLELFAYGDPVGIEVPAPEEVTPFHEAMAGLAKTWAEAGA